MQKSARFIITDNIYVLYERYRSFIRFAIVGCINTAVDFLVFTLSNSILGLDKLVCQVLGYSAGIINSFLMNKLWAFEDRRGSFETVRQMIRFAVINGMSLGISLAGLKVLSDYCGLNVYFSKLTVTIAAQLVNYAGYKLWVFRSWKGLQAG